MEVSTKFSIFNEFALCLNPYPTPFYPIPSMGCLLHDHQLQFSTGKCLFQKNPVGLSGNEAEDESWVLGSLYRLTSV